MNDAEPALPNPERALVIAVGVDGSATAPNTIEYAIELAAEEIHQDGIWCKRGCRSGAETSRRDINRNGRRNWRATGLTRLGTADRHRE